MSWHLSSLKVKILFGKHLKNVTVSSVWKMWIIKGDQNDFKDSVYPCITNFSFILALSPHTFLNTVPCLCLDCLSQPILTLNSTQFSCLAKYLAFAHKIISLVDTFWLQVFETIIKHLIVRILDSFQLFYNVWVRNITVL